MKEHIIKAKDRSEASSPLTNAVVKASIQVLMDGQAYLYAQFFRLQAEMLGKEVSDEEFMSWQDEWKEQGAELIARALTFEGVDRERPEGDGGETVE